MELEGSAVGVLKGTGALRKRVAEYLKKNPRIKSFRLGEWNEGGGGVTVVEL